MNWIRIFLVNIFLCFALSSFASARSLTVVYPDVKAPYDVIFDKINQGIASEYDGKITHVKLPARFKPEEFSDQIDTDKVIALGKRGLAVAKLLYQEKPVVVGALPIAPNGISGISLMASPETLFSKLKILAPQVKKVLVVHTEQSQWIIEYASKIAKNHQLALNSISVADIKGAAETYNNIFEQSNGDTAIWLPLDPVTANDKVIVPEVLKKAWENKMVVFSSKPTHAKRGALFSAIPDNEMLGKQLGRFVNTVDHTKRPSTVLPLDKIKLAVNLRTAAHLGYSYDAEKKSEFDLTFPN